MLRLIVFAGLLLAFLSGCQLSTQDFPLGTPQLTTVSVTPAATEISLPISDESPTIAPTSQAATSPTETALLPSSPTALPTSTPAIVATNTTENTIITPTPLTLIPGLIGPYEYAENVNPLTGETVSDPTVLNRRPLAIKVSNYPSFVRPQAGLNNADLVFEHYAEGVTRFTAIFYSRDANPVGSIRSGRLIDLEIPVMYDASFGYSGSVGPVREMFRNSPFFERIVSPDFAHGGYYRVQEEGKALEHTMFTSTYALRNILAERGLEIRPVYAFGMSFHPDPPSGGTSANRIDVQYNTTNAFWFYNPGTKKYTRWTDGVEHLDANTMEQLNFRNIIILGAHHEDTDIVENTGGSKSIQIQIWGEGPVSIFRDGQRYDGRWRREEPEDMLTYYDLEGNILPLAPGNSFFQVVPLGFTGLVVTP